MLLTNAFVLLASAMFGPIYALFVNKVGGNLLAAGITGGFLALSSGITSLIVGDIVDKTKKGDRIIVSLGYLLLGIGFLMYLFVNSIWFLLIVQILIGFSEAIFFPAFDALYSRHMTKKKAGRVWGAWESTYQFATGFGAILGGIIANKFGFNTLFIIMATLCLTSAAYLLALPKEIL